MPATAAWLASAEALLNRYIEASAQAEALARRLQGTSLQVDIDGMTRVRACAAGGRMMLCGGDDSPADAHISGSLPALLQLLRGGVNRGGVSNGGVHNGSANRWPGAAGTPGTPAAQIRGDAEIANRYRELFMLARPDPEEELSRWVGDFAARRVSQFAQRALDYARRARRTAGENIAEYLQEESRDLVNKTELEEFLRSVDELRETADRIEARLGSLEARLPASGKGAP
jgi:ubiquinone biosynthesis protein UbiJ